MIEAILAHTRQFQHNFIQFLRENDTTDVSLGRLVTAGSLL